MIALPRMEIPVVLDGRAAPSCALDDLTERGV
jgi:hypothetical protein